MQRSGCGIYLVHSAAMHDDETCNEVSLVYGTKDEPWLLPGSALKADRGHQPILLEVEGVAYNEAYPTQDFFVVLKVYSNEFDCFVLKEVLKILALNIDMTFVVDQANLMYANLDRSRLLPLFVL